MAANKYVANVLGRFVEIFGLQVSTGAPDGNKIVAVDNTGRLDISLMPVGITPEVTIIPAFENLAAGDFINIFTDAGVAKARKADASSASKGAQGFVLSAVTAGSNATVYRISNKNTQLAGLTPGAEYWLSATTPGGVTNTSPTGSGNISQYLGVAESATQMVFENVVTIEIA